MLEKNKQLATFIMGPQARMVGGSKSIYRADHPNHAVVFNANLVDGSGHKIWYGDVDITVDLPKLDQLALAIGTLYIISEMDGRFENADAPDISNPILKITGLPWGNEYSYNTSRHTLINGKFQSIPVAPYVPTPEQLAAEKEASETKNPKKAFKAIGKLNLKKVMKPLGKKSPLDEFWSQIKEMYPTIKEVSQVVVDSATEEVLEKALTSYAKKKHKGLHPVKIQQSVSWALFADGPGSFYPASPSWTKEGTVYRKINTKKKK